MKRTELNNLVKRHGLLECDIEDAIEFVNELMECVADEIEKNEPYATNTIDRLRKSAYEVWNILNYVED